EDPEICAHRRLNEELGITGLTLSYRDQLEYRAEVGGGLIEHELVDVFVADVPERIAMRPNPDEVMGTAWVNLDLLAERTRAKPENYTPWLRIYLEKHAEQIFVRA
ncbi:MAG: NUDIX domain-containing protein, partial [Pseudomonadota bacterium]